MTHTKCRWHLLKGRETVEPGAVAAALSAAVEGALGPLAGAALERYLRVEPFPLGEALFLIKTSRGSTPDLLAALGDGSRGQPWSVVLRCNSRKQGDRVERYIEAMKLSRETLGSVAAAMDAERLLGLRQKRDGSLSGERSSLTMLDSFVPLMPVQTEEKVVYAIDFGGSTLRAVRLQLRGDGSFDRQQSITLMREGDNGTDLRSKDTRGGQLFSFMARCLKKLMEENGDLEGGVVCDLALTFSFPCTLQALDKAVLETWVKGWETGRACGDPVEGRDVCEMLEGAIRELGLPARVKASTNDTVGCLVACEYAKPAEAPPCRVGIILGTGINGCYWEAEAERYGYKSHIINTELGGFDKGLPVTDADAELDFHSGDPKTHLFEKCCSGAYIGEVVRLLALRVYQSRAPDAAWVPGTFDSVAVMACAADHSPDLALVGAAVRHAWDEEMVLEDLEDLKKLSRAAVFRSAGLAAAAIIVCARATGLLDTGVTVGVDGSLYLKNEIYRSAIRDSMLLLDSRAGNVVMVASEDGSGQGAALIASL